MPPILFEFIEQFSNKRITIIETAKDLFFSALIIIVGVFLFKGFSRLIKKAFGGKLNIDNNVSSVLLHIIRYAIIIVCAIMVLSIFGLNTTSLIAILGAAGVAIGLALRDTLGNIAAGIILTIFGSYRCGEYIEFGNYNGTVKEINLFTTILETPDGLYISAPNSNIWGGPLKNYSRNGKRRMELSVRISYSDSLDTAFQVINNIVSRETRFLQEPAPQVVLQSLQDNSVNLVIRAWASNQNYWDICWQQIRTLKEKVEEAGLHITFLQTDVRIVKQPV